MSEKYSTEKNSEKDEKGIKNKLRKEEADRCVKNCKKDKRGDKLR